MASGEPDTAGCATSSSGPEPLSRTERSRAPADAFGTAHTVVRGPSRVDACVVERSAEGSWILAVQSRGGGPTVDRALRDARREVATRHGDATDLGDDLRPMRELPARAIDGALVRVSLPLAASAAFADSAVGLESFAALVVDVASGIARVHLVNDDDAVIRDAEALLLAARMVA